MWAHRKAGSEVGLRRAAVSAGRAVGSDGLEDRAAAAGMVTGAIRG